MTKLSQLVATGGLLLANLGTAVADELLTPKHEPGRCAIRGHCGSKSFFGNSCRASITTSRRSRMRS